MSYIFPIGQTFISPLSHESLISVDFDRDDIFGGVVVGTAAVGRFVVDYKVNHYSGLRLTNFNQLKKRKALLPFTPYLSIRQSEITATGAQKHSFAGHTYNFYEKSPKTGAPFLRLKNSTGFPFIFSPVNHVDAFLTAQGIIPDIYVQKAASKAYSKGFDALTFAAEFSQIVRLFKSAGTRLLRFFDDAPRALTEMLHVPFNDWLEARYGWRLILYDLENINDAVKRLHDIERLATKASAQFSQTYTRNLSSVQSFSASTATYSFIEDVTLGVRGSVFTDFVAPILQFNPFVTLYEKITLSFVLDWFFTVGSAINAISLATLADNYTSSYGICYDSSSSGIRSDVWSSGHADLGTWQTVNQKFVVKKRVPMPIPLRPYFSVNLTGLKVTDILALILQRITGFSRGS